MNFFSLFFLGIVLVSCGGTKELSDNKETISSIDTDTVKPQRNVKIKAVLGDFKDSDSYKIKSISVKGNTMLMEITYPGGCANHQFELIGQSMIMKSLPPKRSIILIHDNGDDKCRSIVTRTIEVDIKDLAFKQTPNAEIVLMLKGWENEINYNYSN